MAFLFHIFTIIGTVASLAHAVESKLGPGNGAAKKLAVVEPVLDVANGLVKALRVTPAGTGLPDAVSNLVDATVGLFNALGVFKH